MADTIMALAKLTCPKCRATLKPAKPVPEGKTVKCPKCEETFKAGENGAEAPAKKPAAAAASAPAADDDDDGAGTYAVVRDEEEERQKAAKEERERRKRLKARRRARGEDVEDDEDEDEDEDDGEYDLARELMRNLKARDPRGVAQETVVRPANWLLMTALLGFFGWVLYFIVFMLPIAFPNKEEGGEQAAAQAGKVTVDQKILDAIRDDGGLPFATVRQLDPLKGKQFGSHEEFLKAASKLMDKDDMASVSKATRRFFGKSDKYTHWWSTETILDESNTPWSVLLFVFVLLLGVVQAGIMAIASTKIQSLESYRWGITGMITCLIPLTSFPLFVFLTAMLDLLDSGLEAGWDEITWVMALVAFLIGPIVGAIGLRALTRPHVRPGFEYKPD